MKNARHRSKTSLAPPHTTKVDVAVAQQIVKMITVTAAEGCKRISTWRFIDQRCFVIVTSISEDLHQSTTEVSASRSQDDFRTEKFYSFIIKLLRWSAAYTTSRCTA
jgi:hypothetical protein